MRGCNPIPIDSFFNVIVQSCNLAFGVIFGLFPKKVDSFFGCYLLDIFSISSAKMGV